jgi:hypothetical protein
MGRIDNPTRGEFELLLKRVHELETRSPLSDTAVSDGTARFIGQDRIRIEGLDTVANPPNVFIDSAGVLHLSSDTGS